MKSVLRPSCDDPRSIASGMIRRRRVGLIELHHFFFFQIIMIGTFCSMSVHYLPLYRLSNQPFE